MRVLGLVPARGGSKGVPGKNVRLLGGRPLLAYTADAARAAGRLARVVISTEDTEIADAGRRAGLDVPFLRPSELAGDAVPMLAVVQHALRTLEAAGDRYDAVCLLQPTTPFRAASDIDACIALLDGAGADAVVSVAMVPPEHNPHWVYFRADDGALWLSTGESAPIPRRQDLPPAYHRDGAIYVARRDTVLEQASLYGRRLVGYLSEGAPPINIDTPADWARAEAYLEQHAGASAFGTPTAGRGA